jgi:disulfide bond formation protein DsbB
VYAQIGVLGVSGVLLGAFWVQFGEGECPCLLCLLQRMAMMLTVMGPVFVIAHGQYARVQGFSVQRLGYGISIFEQLGFGD